MEFGMSYSPASAYLHDQGSDLFNELDHQDLFEQFVTFDPMDLEASLPSVLPKSPVLGRPSEHNHSARLSSCPGGVVANGTLQRQTPNGPAGSHGVFTGINISSPLLKTSKTYPDLSGRALHSDSELFDFRNITSNPPADLHSPLPSSPRSPSSTALYRKKSRAPARPSLIVPIYSHRVVSSNMMRASQYSQKSKDIWNRDVKEENLDGIDFHPHMMPLSPPSSAKLSDTAENPAKMLSLGGDQRHDGYSYCSSMSHSYSQPIEYHSPLSTPVLEPPHSRRTSIAQLSLDSSIYPITPQLRNSSISSWTQAPPSDINAFGGNAQFLSEIEGGPVWWHHSVNSLTEPSSDAIHPNHDDTKTLTLHLQNQVAYQAQELSGGEAGLGITGLPHSPVHQSFVVDSSAHQQGFFGAAPHEPYHGSGGTFPPSTSSFSNVKPRSASSGTDSPSPKSMPSPAFHIRKRKPSKGSKNSAPRAQSSSGSIGFVNYTPDDSRKILTGVAPSGSSKTKARREKEAMEKRRKLSQAALRIVRAAGGNVESLVEEGLLC